MLLRHTAVLTAILVLGLGGCVSGGRSDIKLRESLEVPPDLSRPVGDDPTTASGTAVFSDYVARMQSDAKTGNGAGGAPRGVTLERDGALRWLVVQDSPESVLAQVRAYFQRTETKLGMDNAQAGVIETDWNERKVVLGESALYRFLGSMHSSGIRDKYRVRVEPGRKAGTTEVYVTYYGLEEVLVGNSSSSSVTWTPRPADPAMEADLLARLMVHFGMNEKLAKDQVAAGTTSERARKDKNTLILMQDDFDNAWRRVGQALDRAQVTIEDRDRSAGLYYIRYIQTGAEAKSGGLFGWLYGSKDTTREDQDETQNRFQVAVKAQPNGPVVSVRNIKGDPENSKTGERLIDLLYQQLR